MESIALAFGGLPMVWIVRSRRQMAQRYAVYRRRRLSGLAFVDRRRTAVFRLNLSFLIFRTRPRNSLSGPPSDAHRVRGNGCHGMSFVSLTREILIDFHTAAYEQSTWNSLGFPRGSLSTTEIARTRLILWKAEQLARHVAKLITCSLSRHTFCSFC